MARAFATYSFERGKNVFGIPCRQAVGWCQPSTSIRNVRASR
jgi:hypothetical protein